MAKCSIRVELLDDNYSELKGEIAGPPDTPYEGGKFLLEIKVPETYPFNPPKVSNVLRIFSSTTQNITVIFFVLSRSNFLPEFGIQIFRPLLEQYA